jgi:hypothetical protein
MPQPTEQTASGAVRVEPWKVWTACVTLAAANLVLALLFPSLHGEGEPMSASISGRCLLEAEQGFGPLLGCLKEGALNYGWSYYALSTAVAALLGENFFSAVLVTSGCFAAALAGGFRLAERLAGARAGLWAVALLLGYPVFAYYGRRVQFEMFQAALVVWFLVLLLDSDGLRRVRPVLGMAALLTAGAWCKPSTVFFTVPAAGLCWLLQPGDRRQRLRGLLGLAVAVGGAVPVLAWYKLVRGMWQPATVVADHMVRSQLLFPWSDVDGPGLLAGLRFHGYFVRVFSNYQAGLALALVAAVALAVALRRGKRDDLVVWSAYLGGFAVHSALAYKKFYYTMPALAAAAAGSAAWIARLKPGRRRRALEIGLALICLASLLRWQLNVYGPDDLVPDRLHAAIGFNDPPGFHPEPRRFASSVAPDLPILLALAEQHDGLDLAVLARGGKIEILSRQPDIYGFEHTLTYEFQRRGVPVRTSFAQHGGSLMGSRVLYLYPPVGWTSATLEPEQVFAGCLAVTESPNRDLTERTSDIDCERAVAEYEALLPRLDVVHVDSFGPTRLRALAVIRQGGHGLTPAVAARALVYAEALEALEVVPERVRVLAGQASPEERTEARDRPLRYRRHGDDQRVFPR